MSIFNKLFGTAPVQSSVPPVTPPANNPPGSSNQNGSPTLGTQQTQQTGANGIVPEIKEDPNASPLDKHKDIWQTPTIDPKDAPKPGMFDNFDPAKMMEAAGKIDFSKVLTPEISAKLQAGGQDAAVAFAEGLNKVAQTVYGQSAVATANIVKEALKEQKASFEASLPGLMKGQQVDEALQQANALYNKPAVQPLVGALRTQLLQKYPQASASEVKDHIVNYLKDMSTEFAPKAPDTQNKTGPKEQDWSLFESQ